MQSPLHPSPHFGTTLGLKGILEFTLPFYKWHALWYMSYCNMVCRSHKGQAASMSIPRVCEGHRGQACEGVREMQSHRRYSHHGPQFQALQKNHPADRNKAGCHMTVTLVTRLTSYVWQLTSHSKVSAVSSGQMMFVSRADTRPQYTPLYATAKIRSSKG